MARYFGTNGIREVVGERLTPEFVTGLVGAFAQVLKDRRPAVVGTDGRTSSPGFGRIAAGVLSLAGQDVVELGALPTPALQYSVPRLGAAFAVIVTASHNPPEFNGIKGIAADGLEIPPEVERAIEAAFEAKQAPRARYDGVAPIRTDARGGERYIAGILGCVQVEKVRAARPRVVLDCGNGASCVTSPTLLRELGVRYTTLNGNIDGTFPGHPSEPTEANLQDLLHTVPAVGADLGVAHDGDADRAVFVDAYGRYVPGEKVLTLLAREAVAHAGGGTVVTPVTSSRSVEDVVGPLGGKVRYTRVGSPVVTRAMQETKAVFGGEENGGCIFPELHLARDGAMTLARLLEIVAVSGKPLHQLVEELPPYHLVKRKVTCPLELRESLLAEIPSLLETGGGESRVETLDGVKVIRPSGWVLVRPSGTEPLYRVFAESKDRAEAEALADGTVRKVEELIRRRSAK